MAESAQVTGSLTSDCGIHDQSDDMLLVQFENGIGIDVGWRPEESNLGCFWLIVYRDNFENQIFRSAERDVMVVARMVEMLAAVVALVPR